MINLDFELSSALDAQERYDIIGFAMDAADDNGFINSFVFERAIYCFAAIMLYPEKKEELAPIVARNPIEGWKYLVENDIIQDMQEQYSAELNVLTEEAGTWFLDYSEWAHSARGVLEMVQQFSGNIVQNAAAQLNSTAQQTGVSDLLEIAQDWGMNREALKEELTKEQSNDPESLFEK